MRGKQTVEVLIEVRTCPSCKRSFKTAPDSPTIFDSRFCEDLEQHQTHLEPLILHSQQPQTFSYTELNPVPKARRRRNRPRYQF